MSARAAYTPGTWVAVGADAGWLLVDIDPTDAVVLEAWSLLRAAADIDEILDVVLQRGLRAVRGFALVRVSGDDRLVVVRGAADAIITVDGQESHVTAAGVATWREYPLPANASAVQLRAGEIAGVDEAPLSAGVTLAATIRVAVTDVSQTARLGPAKYAQPARPVAGTDRAPERPDLRSGPPAGTGTAAARARAGPVGQRRAGGATAAGSADRPHAAGAARRCAFGRVRARLHGVARRRPPARAAG